LERHANRHEAAAQAQHCLLRWYSVSHPVFFNKCRPPGYDT
jgi:hypothetical protein